MDSSIVDTLRSIVGPGNVLTGEEIVDRSALWDTNQPCLAPAVVRPASTDEVSAILAFCNERGQSVVPQGGMTNLVLGAVTSPDDIALSFERMNRIENVDPVARTLTAQAGVTMQAAQEAADERDLYFPVDIGARANCMLGGNVSTNAGGTHVIRYGMMRESVLGLEAVLADGTVVSSMNAFLKNNSGFDLKQLFIGTEGVLGLVTRAVLRLRDKPKSTNVALLACDDYQQVVALLNRSRELLGGALSGFEVMWDNYFDAVVEPRGRLPSPIDTGHRFYIIVEATGTQPETDDAAFEAALAAMFEADLVADGAIAKSGPERDAIWEIRHDVEWVLEGALTFDVSLPVADVYRYTEAVETGLERDIPGVQVVTFGHLGDNNIHICVQCDGARGDKLDVIERHVYEALEPFSGAISAEHGIGTEKMRWLPVSRSADEIELMKTLKRALDPANILNPGKVVSLD